MLRLMSWKRADGSSIAAETDTKPGARNDFQYQGPEHRYGERLQQYVLFSPLRSEWWLFDCHIYRVRYFGKD